MSPFDQPRNVRVDDTGSASVTLPPFTSGDPAYGRADTTLPLTVVGEAMIERAKTVVIVAQRVDEEEAEQILYEAACEAHIPVRVAADQVMTALEADVDQAGLTQDTLERALAAVHPVEDPQVGEPLTAGQPAPSAA
jgi:CO dehydrogenase/acetyl-CoA synthase epsilon subunit